MFQKLLGLEAERFAFVPREHSAIQPFTTLRRSRRAAAAWLGFTALVSAAIWCVLAQRWSVESWQTPPGYSGDALEVLARLKGASEFEMLPVAPDHVTRLGAPFGAEWSEYPSPDDVAMLAGGLLSRAIGLAPAANALLLFAFVSASVAFAACARWLGYRWEWAVAAGLLFAFSYHNSVRGLAHLTHVLNYTTPLILLSSWLVARSRSLRWKSRGAALLATTAVCVGIGNPYNVFLFAQLMSLAIFATWVAKAPRGNVVAGVATLALAFTVFAVVNADVWFASGAERGAPVIARNYGGVEEYALKPIELLTPSPAHRIEAFAAVGQRYLRWSEWRSGEAFSPYLGTVGGVSFIALLLCAGAALARGEGRRAGLGAQATWILLFSAVGGANAVLALFAGLQVFRATNRYSVFLLALALFFFARVASSLTRGAPRALSIALATLVGGLGIWEQTPRATAQTIAAAETERYRLDQAFGADMERLLPKGAMVFQLPHVNFPEAGTKEALPDYELFSPYLHTRELRFTYGDLKRRARNRWYREYASLPAAELTQRLETAGFAAIYIDARGYADQAAALLADLAAAGYHPVLEDGHRRLIVLRPAAVVRPPVAAAFTFGDGWHKLEHGEPRWAHGAATLTYFNPTERPAPLAIHLQVSAPDERQLNVFWNGETEGALTIGPRPSGIEYTVTLQPGVNELTLKTVEPARRVTNRPGGLRAFAVHSAEVELPRDVASR